jgi:hypothetical protein
MARELVRCIATVRYIINGLINPTEMWNPKANQQRVLVGLKTNSPK